MENNQQKDIHVAGICGSIREGSFTRKALSIALDGAREVGASTTLIDLSDYSLVFCDGKREDADLPEDVVRLRNDIRAAHGILIGTPEYHGSLSGVLKNALDLMGFSEFRGKMLGLLGVSGGRLGAASALSTLRTIGRSLHAWVIPAQASIPEAWNAFASDGSIRDAELNDRIMDVGRQVARYAYLHSSRKALEFIEAWETGPSNPGGGV